MTVPTVLYVHHGSGRGGAAVSLGELLSHIDTSRYRPVVAVDFRRTDVRKFFRASGVRTVDCQLDTFTHTMKTWRWTTPQGAARLARWAFAGRPATMRALARVLYVERPQLVHFNGLSVLPYAPVVTERGLPVVQHIRESINAGVFGVRRRWMERVASRHASAMIYICRDNAERLSGVTTPGDVIYNPVDITRFANADRAAARVEIGVRDNEVLLLFPGGSFFDVKGIKPFTQAVAQLRAAGRSVRALIPSADGVAREAVTRANIADAVIYAQFTDSVERYYAAADIVVAPFTVPHFSRAVIEAGAARRPVVASRIGGITEVVEENLTGLLAVPGDAADLARKIRYLLDHPDKASAMADAGFAITVQRYGATAHARAVMAVYDRVMAG